MRSTFVGIDSALESVTDFSDASAREQNEQGGDKTDSRAGGYPKDTPREQRKQGLVHATRPGVQANRQGCAEARQIEATCRPVRTSEWKGLGTTRSRRRLA